MGQLDSTCTQPHRDAGGGLAVAEQQREDVVLPVVARRGVEPHTRWRVCESKGLRNHGFSRVARAQGL
jgi:hypothetical protein